MRRGKGGRETGCGPQRLNTYHLPFHRKSFLIPEIQEPLWTRHVPLNLQFSIPVTKEGELRRLAEERRDQHFPFCQLPHTDRHRLPASFYQQWQVPSSGYPSTVSLLLRGGKAPNWNSDPYSDYQPLLISLSLAILLYFAQCLCKPSLDQLSLNSKAPDHT